MDLTQVNLWSDVEQAIVAWNVTLEEDSFGSIYGPSEHTAGVLDGIEPAQSIVLKYNDETHRLSSSYTDEEILILVDDINREKQGQPQLLRK